MKTDAEKSAYCQSRGVDSSHHCCLSMAYNISHPVETPHQGCNRVIDWIASWDEYMIPVSHDGYAATIIQFCPWCGAKLRESKRDLWHQTLYKLGCKDPGNQELPKEFKSDKWWRNL